MCVQGARLREKSENDNVEEAEDEDEDDDDDEEIDEELGYISPLENVNPYVSFKQALTSALSFLPCNVSNLTLPQRSKCKMDRATRLRPLP